MTQATFKNALVALCAIILTGFLAMASAKNDGPTTFVENLSKQAITTLTEKGISRADRDHRFRVLLNQNFDVPSLGRFALGRYWRTASSQQQQEYLGLFENIVVYTYSDRFAKYSGQKVEVIGSSRDDDSIVVKSRLIQPDDSEPVLIDWRLKPSGKDFKITDVIVEGVSMSVNQRNEFASVIERNGGDIDALLKVLRQKTEARKQAQATASSRDN
jgi:phospholipid transport system substrate-binding protein